MEDRRWENDWRRKKEDGRRKKMRDVRGWEILNGGLFGQRKEEEKEMVDGDMGRDGEKT